LEKILPVDAEWLGKVIGDEPGGFDVYLQDEDDPSGGNAQKGRNPGYNRDTPR